MRLEGAKNGDHLRGSGGHHAAGMLAVCKELVLSQASLGILDHSKTYDLATIR